MTIVLWPADEKSESLRLTQQELRDLVTMLDDDWSIFFCSAHRPSFSAFEPEFDRHMREVHAEPNWRDSVIGV